MELLDISYMEERKGMDINKLHYWPAHFFALLFNSSGNRQDRAKPHTVNFQTNAQLSTQASKASHGSTLQHAQEQIVDGFNDLITILESFHDVYNCEVTHKSPQCVHYQQQAIRFAQAIAEKNTQDLPFDLLRHSDAFNLFRALQQLKNYRWELPSGWYEAVKTHINHIIDANHCYHDIKERVTH